MTETISHYWQRRGNAIYTEGRFLYSKTGPTSFVETPIEGSADLVIDFGHVLHIDDIDRIVMSHNDALDMHAAYEIETGSTVFDKWTMEWF